MLKLSHIFVYPVKSLSGISCQSAELEIRGIKDDRRWMLVDSTGRFLSQREYPKMVQIGTLLEDGQLWLFDRNKPSDRILVPQAQGQRIETQVWDDVCDAQLVSIVCDAWLSEQLGAVVRLVYMPDDSIRPADTKYAPQGQYVSLADGYPYLMIGQASLDDLNSRLESEVPMNRFRPNFVFTGGNAFEEDTWSNFKMGDIDFKGVKPCSRCIITTTDQDSGIRSSEPLKTLSTYRQSGHKILFGQNCIWTGTGNQTVTVGDEIHLENA